MIQPPATVVLRLAHVSLGTPNLDRAIPFYRDILGATIAHEFRNDAGERYGVFLHVGQGTFIELFCDSHAGASSTSAFRHLCFEVADIEAAAERLRAFGYAPAIRRGRTDSILQFFIVDADGNKVEFQEHDEQSVLRRFVDDGKA